MRTAGIPIKYLKNWPAPSVWVFIAQLVEHCSPKTLFLGYFAIASIAITHILFKLLQRAKLDFKRLFELFLLIYLVKLRGVKSPKWLPCERGGNACRLFQECKL